MRFIWPSLVLRHGLLLKGSCTEPAAGYDVTTGEPRLTDTPQQRAPQFNGQFCKA